jgi:hypothetical protein
MLDLTAVRRRYFLVKFDGRILEVEPPKLKTLNKLVAISKAAGNGDPDAFSEMTPLIAKLLSKNKKNIKIAPAAIEESLDRDQMSVLLTEFFSWLSQERNDPN